MPAKSATGIPLRHTTIRSPCFSTAATNLEKRVSAW